MGVGEGGWGKGSLFRLFGYSHTSYLLDDLDFNTDLYMFLFFSCSSYSCSYECANKRTDECTNKRTNKCTNECTNKCTNKCTNQSTNQFTNQPTRLVVLFSKYTLCSFYHKYKLCEYVNVLIEIAVKIFITWYLSHLSIFFLFYASATQIVLGEGDIVLLLPFIHPSICPCVPI